MPPSSRLRQRVERRNVVVIQCLGHGQVSDLAIGDVQAVAQVLIVGQLSA